MLVRCVVSLGDPECSDGIWQLKVFARLGKYSEKAKFLKSVTFGTNWHPHDLKCDTFGKIVQKRDNST